MAKKRLPPTYDQVILRTLIYEFHFDDPRETDLKIKRRLLYHKCGPYFQDRVELLRRLKNALQKEIGRHEKSRFYLGPHGRFAAMEDFDVKRLVEVHYRKFPDVAISELERFVPFAIFTYYLR